MQKSILLDHLELLQTVGGKEETANKLIVTKEGLITSFQGAFITMIRQEFDFTGVFDLPTFLSIVKSMKSDEIELEHNADKFELILSALRTRIGLKEIDLPNKDEIISAVQTKPKKKPLPENFIQALQLCSSCTSKGDSVLSNIMIHNNKVIGSDNDKIGIYSIDFPERWLIESELVAKIIKLNPTHYYQKDGRVWFFRTDDIFSVCSLSEGDYPDLQKILDKETDTEISIPSEMKEGIGVSVGLFTSVKEQEKIMKVSLLKNRIVIRTESDYGWMDKTIRTKYSGKEFSFIINAFLLSEMLENISSIFISESMARMSFDNFTFIIAIELKE